jgi:hypothetical protein
METVTVNPNWQDLLNEALTKPCIEGRLQVLRAIKQKIKAWDDVDNYWPLLMKLAQRETPEGERVNVSRIIRRAIRAELVRCKMIRERKAKPAMAPAPGGEA